MHHKDEVKVVCTFDATLRAGKGFISYMPDGGDTQEIFSADADYFRTSSNKRNRHNSGVSLAATIDFVFQKAFVMNAFFIPIRALPQQR